VRPDPTAGFTNVAQDDLIVQARRALTETVPGTAARAEPEVAHVLWLASNARNLADDQAIADAARRMWPRNLVPVVTAGAAPGTAQPLHDQARQAFTSQRNVAQAFDLQLRAFGADPRDPDVAGNLAFLYLKVTPAQPDIARKLAMHAMALRSVQMRAPRIDDWTTFAVASALTGRDDDAINALFVTIALAGNLDRSCRAAVDAVATHGDKVRMPVDAMMQRIRWLRRDGESPYCAWPQRSMAGNRYF
jgi:hypothetical protein